MISHETNSMKLYVRYMQSEESLARVKVELMRLGFNCPNLKPGEIDVSDHLDMNSYNKLRNHLENEGFQVLSDRKTIIAERIRHYIIDLAYGIEDMPKLKLSSWLSEKFNLDYDYLGSIFSEINGVSIEHFLIRQKIERVKEMLIIGTSSISQISYQLNYSSVSHLSKQFKKVTGMTPKTYRELHSGKGHNMKMCERCNSFL
jgi:AraC-like DNA-binding protein